MENAQDIIAHIGPDRIMALLGVKKRRMYQLRRPGACLPADWFDALEREAGRELPRSAFTFLKPAI
jgi:hypothetical protein